MFKYMNEGGGLLFEVLIIVIYIKSPKLQLKTLTYSLFLTYYIGSRVKQPI